MSFKNDVNEFLAGCLGQLLGLFVVGLVLFFIMKYNFDKDEAEHKQEHRNYVSRFDYDVDALVKKVIRMYPNFKESFRPFSIGKSIIIEKSEDFEEPYFNDNMYLAEENVAFKRKDLEYIIFREYREEKVGMYDNNETAATRLNMEITILDPHNLKVIARKYVIGEAPPNSIRYSGSAPETESGGVGKSLEDVLMEMSEEGTMSLE
jgi:hypothetical protein